MTFDKRQWDSLAEMHRELRREAEFRIEAYGFLAATEGISLDDAIGHLEKGWDSYECPE